MTDLEYMIALATGCNADHPHLQYATNLPCDRCGQVTDTALLNDADDASEGGAQRLCVACVTW